MKYVVSNLLVFTDPSNGVVQNINTSECFEFSTEVIRLIAYFKSPRSISEVLNILKLKPKEASEIKLFLQYLRKNKILVRYPEVASSWGDSVKILSDKVLVQGTRKTFLSCPSVGLNDVKCRDIAFLGVPFDLGTTGFPGTRFGPDRMRELSCDAFEYHADIFNGTCRGWYSLEHSINVLEGKRFVDIGNVIHQIGEGFDEFFNRLGKSVTCLLNKDAFPIIIGGDHSCSYTPIRAFKQKFGQIGVIHIDAHVDLGNLLPGIPNNHGNIFTRVLKENLVEHLYQFGARGLIGNFHSDERYSLYPLCKLEQEGLNVAIAELDTSINYYISIDIDVLDPALAPGTGTPIPFGMKVEMLKKLLSLLSRKISVVGFDLVEVNPMLDQSNRTVDLANSLILYFLTELGLKRKDD